MYNLLVSGIGWKIPTDEIDTSRVFEYTEEYIRDSFSANGVIGIDDLIKLPCLFMQETWPDGSHHHARVGNIISAKAAGKVIKLEFVYDNTIPPLTNEQIKVVQTEFDIKDFEFSRTHWAVKDVDLFKVLFRYLKPRRQVPTVFHLSEVEHIEPTLVAVMMPFDLIFSPVYEKFKEIANNLGLHCRRADDIWENPAIIQDVVSLIDHSRVVICDCTGRNPNVFYEAGIAHTLGREVILVTQNEHDIPFDLRHLRYVKYLNNNEGLQVLGSTIESRLSKLIEID